jgi:hypothetical protein
VEQQLEQRYWYFRAMGFDHGTALTMVANEVTPEEKIELEKLTLTEVEEDSTVEFIEDL